MQYSVVNYKTVLIEDESMRFDADFYMPDFLKNAGLLKEKNAEKLDNLCTKKRITKGETPLWQGFSYEETGIPFVRSQDLVFGSIKNDEFVFVSEKYHKLKKRSEIQNGDSLIAIVGATIGVIGFYDLNEPANCNQAVAIIRLNNQTFSKYIQVFLHSEIAQKQIKRFQGGNARDNLDLDEVRKIKVILPSSRFNSTIEQIFDKAKEKINHSKSLYSQAEQLLLSELGLADWKPKHQLTFVKNFSDTQKAKRIDAEYFQPKYEEIIEAVKKYKGGFDLIKGQFKQNKKSFKKILNEEYQYIEIGSVNISDGSTEPMTLQGDELPANAKIKLQKNDVIVSKVRPYRGAIGIVDNENYVGSGAFTVLQENGAVNKETLFVYLRLKPLLDFSLKFNTGTSYPTITDEDILNFPLPKIDSKTQEEIKKKITEMYETKRLSKSLLEIAKRGVEMAIEKDEQEAEKWIESELKAFNL